MKRIIAIYAGGTAVLILLWLTAIFMPLRKEHQRLISDITTAKAQLLDFEVTLRQVPSFLKATSNMEQSRSMLQSSLYAKEDILELVKHITDDARALHLQITDITPPVSELIVLNRKVYNPSDPDFLNLTLDISGDFVDFGKYVTGLEEEPFFRGVNDCQIFADNHGRGTTTASIGFKALLGHIDTTGVRRPDE